MASARLYRLGGLALLFGAVLGIAGNVLNSALFPNNNVPLQPSQSTLWTIVWLVSLVGQMFMLMGLASLLAREFPYAGTLGTVGYVLTFLGGFLLTSFSVIAMVIFPWLAQSASNLMNSGPPPSMFVFFLVSNILFAVGGLLLGISIMRTGVFPRTAGLLLVIGAVLGAVGFPLNGVLSTILSTLSFVVFAVGLGWIGYVLMQEERTVVTDTREQRVA